MLNGFAGYLSGSRGIFFSPVLVSSHVHTIKARHCCEVGPKLIESNMAELQGRNTMELGGWGSYWNPNKANMVRQRGWRQISSELALSLERREAERA